MDNSRDPRLAEIRVQAEQQYRDRGEMRPVFVHQNRDGSVAFAVGLCPDVWPEDEPKPPDVRNGKEAEQ